MFLCVSFAAFCYLTRCFLHPRHEVELLHPLQSGCGPPGRSRHILVAVIRADDVLQDAHVPPAVQQTTAVSIRQEVRQQDDIMHRVSLQNKGSTLYNIISHVVYIIKYEVNDLNVHT